MGKGQILSVCFVYAFLFLLSSCGGRVEVKKKALLYPPSLPKKRVFFGYASWYGKDFHKKRTASGEIYNMHQLTAAHRTLPFGTYCLVTNLNNGRAITVRINDRGPFVKGRIIDLSFAAAKALDMVEDGVCPVKVVVLGKKRTFTKLYTIQLGSFIEEKNAKDLFKKAKEIRDDVRFEVFYLGKRKYYRIRVGFFKSAHEAYLASKIFAKNGFSPIILGEK